VTERTKTREAYRKTRGAKVAAIVERLTIDDTLSPADRTRIDNEAMVLENELLGAEQTLAAARRAIADLQREPTFHHFREARDLSANVSFV
jgi:pantoate kinase